MKPALKGKQEGKRGGTATQGRIELFVSQLLVLRTGVFADIIDGNVVSSLLGKLKKCRDARRIRLHIRL